jgi:cell division protein FtsN
MQGTAVNQMIAAASRGRPAMSSTVAVAPVEAGWTPPAAHVAAPPGFFIQVGAFANIDNAERAKFNLANLGDVEVTPVSASMGTLYKVTLWPSSPGVAGQTLSMVRAAGHPDARLVIAQN